MLHSSQDEKMSGAHHESNIHSWNFGELRHSDKGRLEIEHEGVFSRFPARFEPCLSQTLSRLLSDYGRIWNRTRKEASPPPPPPQHVLLLHSGAWSLFVLGSKPFHSRLLTIIVSETRQDSNQAVNLLKILSCSVTSRLLRELDTDCYVNKKQIVVRISR